MSLPTSSCRTLGCLLLLTVPALAQVTATVTAATQLIVRAGNPGTSDSRPAGFNLTGGLHLSTSFYQLPSLVTADATFALTNTGGTISYTVHEYTSGSLWVRSAGPHATILQLASPVPVAGMLSVQYSGPSGSYATAAVDVGNDSSNEWVRTGAAGGQSWQMPVVVHGTLPIRISTSVSEMVDQLTVQFRPLAVPVGAGCVEGFASYYQWMTPLAMDLAGREVVLDDYGGGFLVSSRPGTIQPIGSLGTATQVPLTDDSAVVMGALAMEIHSNCQVAFAPGNSTDYVPSIAALLNDNPATALYAWTDLNPEEPGSGQVWYEENGWDYQVTYDGVYAYGTTQPVTVQFRGNRGYNSHVIAFGPTLQTTGENWLIGYSPGGANLDPGAIDYSALTAAAPYVSREPDLVVPTLSPVSAPVLGAPFQVTTDNIGAHDVLLLGLVGFSDPNLSLDFLGLDASCTLRAAPDILVGPAFVAGQSSLTWTVADLSTGAVSGLQFYVQGVTMDLSLLSNTTRVTPGLKVTIP